MAKIIRHRSGQALNPLNKWPSNGFYTRDHYPNDIMTRQFFHIASKDVSTVVGNAFEQTDMPILTVKITARPHPANRSQTFLDVRLENVRQEEIPIESMDRLMLSDYLKNKIHHELLVTDVIHFTIRCHVKGWFW